MNRRALTYAAYGYAGFCVINWAVTYYAARTGAPLSKLNESLRPYNLLARVIDPWHAANGTIAAATPLPTPNMQPLTPDFSNLTPDFGSGGLIIREVAK